MILSCVHRKWIARALACGAGGYRLGSSGDTIPNCWANSGKSRERTGIAPYGHPAGTLGATGVERLRPRENGQGSDGGERGQTDRFCRRDRPVWCHTKERGRSSRSDSVRSFPIRVSASGSSQRGRVCSWPDPAGPDGAAAWGGRRENSGQGDGGAPTLTGCQEVSSPFRSQRGFVGRMGVKRPEKGSKWRL